MECRNIQKELIFYLDGELPEERMKSIGEHLDGCPSCSAFLEELKKDMVIIEVEKKPDVSSYFFTRLSVQLDERAQVQERNAWTRLVQPAFFSLLLIIGVYGGLRLGYNASAPVAKQPQISVMPYMDDFADEPIESFLLEQL